MSEKKTKYILSIDLGTSGPKTALVSVYGEVVDYQFEENRLILLPGGGAEQDPAEWWGAIMRTAKKVLAKGLVPVEDVVAVCCSTQWSGTVAVDQEGNHLMNAVIWMDSRGKKYIDDLTGGLLKFEGYDIFKVLRWIRLTGGAPTRSGKDSIAHIHYIKNELPEVYKKTFKFLEPKDYINMRLSGRFAASFDSIILHWVTDNRDISNIVYDDRLLALAGIEREKLPDLKPVNGVLGPIKKEVADELGLRRDVEIIMGTPDVQCAAVGAGAVKDYEGHLYLGTSSWLTCHVPFKKTDIFHGMGSLPSAIPGRYFVANEQETAGACLTHLKDNILYHKDELLLEEKALNVYKIFDRLAAKAPVGSNKLIFTPWLYGERTPVEDHTVRSGFFNQSLRTTRDHIIRAVFEGVAYNSRWLLMYVEKFIKRKMDAISLVGGGANSDIWCQIHADVLQRTIKQVKDPILTNLRGAAFLASAALGYIEFDDIAQYIQIKNTFEPDPDNGKIYDELFREFINIYKANKKIYRRLNG
ncbi:MAG: xylulose kinase [Desulfobacterales bacterium]|nr:xylulose kinase [Desulfobacterales bacterium]